MDLINYAVGFAMPYLIVFKKRQQFDHILRGRAEKIGLNPKKVSANMKGNKELLLHDYSFAILLNAMFAAFLVFKDQHTALWALILGITVLLIISIVRNFALSVKLPRQLGL